VSELFTAVAGGIAVAAWIGKRLAKRAARPPSDKGLPWMVKRRIPEALRKARVTTIDDVHDGELVAVCGRVEASDALVAPMTRTPCVAFDFLVQGTWSRAIVARAVRGSVFALTDGKSRVLVDGRTALIRVVFGGGQENLARASLSEPELLPEDAERALLTGYEGIVAVGAQVVVIGVVSRTAPVDDGAYRGTGEVVRIAATHEHGSMVSTVPNDLLRYHRAGERRGSRM
jgi:hypothetical protein